MRSTARSGRWWWRCRRMGKRRTTSSSCRRRSGAQSWPHEDETGRLATLVATRVQQVGETVGERLERLGELGGLQDQLYETIAIPPPKPLGNAFVYHEEGMPPSIGHAFVGRSRELWELHHELATRAGGAARTVSLEGGGGFGKTRLAVEYVHRYGPPEYAGGLVTGGERRGARTTGSRHSSTRSWPCFDRAFRTSRRSGESSRDIARELGEALRDVAQDRRVLYVVDNVPEPHGEQAPDPLSRGAPLPDRYRCS